MILWAPMLEVLKGSQKRRQIRRRKSLMEDKDSLDSNEEGGVTDSLLALVRTSRIKERQLCNASHLDCCSNTDEGLKVNEYRLTSQHTCDCSEILSSYFGTISKSPSTSRPNGVLLLSHTSSCSGSHRRNWSNVLIPFIDSFRTAESPIPFNCLMMVGLSGQLRARRQFSRVMAAITPFPFFS